MKYSATSRLGEGVEMSKQLSQQTGQSCSSSYGLVVYILDSNFDFKNYDKIHHLFVKIQIYMCVTYEHCYLLINCLPLITNNYKSTYGI